ncbi:MAG TPA: SDR family oxidoreductase [Limnochordia bacterium]|nr:SDR family oxidoreductase [Limnochordia bacterium]
MAGKWALVTGSSRGFGRAIALRLAAEGANIVVNYRRSRSEAEETAEAIRAKGAAALVIQANVGDEADVARLFAEIEQHCGGLSILVSNAAFGKLGPVMEATDKHWNATFDVCAKALMWCAQRAVPLMERAGYGRIVSMTSQGSHRVIEGYGLVGPAKAALESLTRALAVELAPKGITVNGIDAGTADTRSFRAIPGAEEHLQKAVAGTPMGRIVQTADVADAVAFLCSNQAKMICGHFLVVDGGASIVY